MGVSLRYQSLIQNFDRAFLLFEQMGAVDWGFEDWLEGRYELENGKWGVDRPKAPLLVDFRVGWNLSDEHRVSLVVSNLLNKEYSVRPLAIEAPRLINLVYTYEL